MASELALQDGREGKGRGASQRWSSTLKTQMKYVQSPVNARGFLLDAM